MDYQGFINLLPSLYENWGQESVRPKSSQFQKIREQVAGFTTANILQLLNCAVKYLKSDEIYCEFGCGEGANLIGALVNHSDKQAFTIDNFSQADYPEHEFKKLTNALSHFNLENQVSFFAQDSLEFLTELKYVNLDVKIGVIFLNSYQDYRTQLLQLFLVRPFLANRALIITHNSNWSPVQQANWDFMSVCSQSHLLLDLRTSASSSHTFGNGIQVLAFDKKQEHKDNASKAKYFSDYLIDHASCFQLKFQPPEPVILPGNYVKIDNFLKPEINQQFLETALQNKKHFVASEVGEDLQDFDARQSLLITSDLFPQCAELIISEIAKIQTKVLNALNKPLFMVSKVEAQMTVHRDGGYYKTHTDNDPIGFGDCTREITYVYYFYKEPKNFQGGELRIYETQIVNESFRSNGNFIEIQPQNNSIVFFDSRCLHEVLPVTSSSKAFEAGRFTVNGWLHL